MITNERELPGLMAGFVATVKRDLVLAWKRPGDVLNPVVFFAVVSTLFPLATGASPEQLQFSGPGVLWVAALLATLLSLNSLFLADYEDGSLDQFVVSLQPLPMLALAKALAHWLTSGLPLLLVSPLVAVSFRMPAEAIGVLIVTLLFGTISLGLVGSIGAALTIGLHRGTVLLSLLILPLAMPILILGARTVSLAATNETYSAGIYFLAAYAVAALALAPFAAAAALRISYE